MSRVFAVQQPTNRDRETGAIKPSMDLSPALVYGELRFILRDWENPFNNFQATAQEVQRVLEAEEFGDDDWLLLVGNPCLIGLVSAEVALRTGRLKLLQWDRADHRYLPVIAQLDDGDALAA